MTPHPSGLTPPPYKNKQYYKGGTNDKTHDSHTHEYGVSRRNDASLTRNLDAENKNTEDDEYIDHPSIKKWYNWFSITWKNQKNTIIKKVFIESNQFGFV